MKGIYEGRFWKGNVFGLDLEFGGWKKTSFGGILNSSFGNRI